MKLSDSMRYMLVNLAAGRTATAGLRGQAAHGGAMGTWHALVKRGLIDPHSGAITDAGREALK